MIAIRLSESQATTRSGAPSPFTFAAVTCRQSPEGMNDTRVAPGTAGLRTTAM